MYHVTKLVIARLSAFRAWLQNHGSGCCQTVWVEVKERVRIQDCGMSSLVESTIGSITVDVAGEVCHSEPLCAHTIIQLGRDPKQCQIPIAHVSISRVHLLIWCVEFDSNTCPLVHLYNASRYPIYVDRNKCSAGHGTILTDGACITVGTIVSLTVILSNDRLDYGVAPTTVLIHRELILKRGWILSDHLVGRGSFGSIYAVTHTNTCSKQYAVKIVNKSASSYFEKPSPTSNRATLEAKLLMRLNHPNIVKVYDAFSSRNHIYIVEELVCGGDLFSYMTRGDEMRAVPESEARFIIYQIIHAVRFLHSKHRIIHRDLKLDNILLGLPRPGARIYLCDFGIAKKLELKVARTATAVGTIEYSAPEVFGKSMAGTCHKAPYDSMCDMWSIGIITYVLLTGISPLYSAGNDKCKRPQIDWESDRFKSVSPAAKDFSKRLLKVCPHERMSASDCFNHVWIKNAVPQLESAYRNLFH